MSNNVTISQLPSLPVGVALSSGALLPIVQNMVTSQVTVGDLLTLGTSTSVKYDYGTGSAKLPAGDNSTRSSPAVIGMVRYNTYLGYFEGYGNTGWVAIGGNTNVTYDTVSGSAKLPAGNNEARSLSPQAGMIRFNSQLVYFEGFDGNYWSPIGGSGTTSVQYDSGTGSAKIPAGGSAFRSPSPSPGWLRYNTDINRFEGWNNSAWGSLGGATGGGIDAVFYLNDQIINSPYTLIGTQNAMTAGPISIANGITVTLNPGAIWTVV